MSDLGHDPERVPSAGRPGSCGGAAELPEYPVERIHRLIHNMWITVWETCQRQRVDSTTPMTITPNPISRFQLLSVVSTGTFVLVLAVT
jgi:hypothetical protein